VAARKAAEVRHVLSVLFLAAVAQAQPVYTAIYEDATLSSAAGVTTIQQPAAPKKKARLIGVKVYSSAEVVVTLEHSGTAATTTASTSITRQPGVNELPTLLFYTASNAGAGQVWDKTTIPAGTEKTWGCLDEEAWCGTMPKTVGMNWTVRSASMTGTLRVTWMWAEQ
jgi:hypothetical protein